MPIPKNLTKDFFISLQSSFLIDNLDAAVINENENNNYFDGPFPFIIPFFEYDDDNYFESFDFDDYNVPEVFENNVESTEHIEYDDEINIFSFSMILYELFTKRRNKKNQKHIKHSIQGKDHTIRLCFTEKPHFIYKRFESYLYSNMIE